MSMIDRKACISKTLDQRFQCILVKMGIVKLRAFSYQASTIYRVYSMYLLYQNSKKYGKLNSHKQQHMLSAIEYIFNVLELFSMALNAMPFVWIYSTIFFIFLMAVGHSFCPAGIVNTWNIHVKLYQLDNPWKWLLTFLNNKYSLWTCFRWHLHFLESIGHILLFLLFFSCKGKSSKHVSLGINQCKFSKKNKWFLQSPYYNVRIDNRRKVDRSLIIAKKIVQILTI